MAGKMLQIREDIKNLQVQIQNEIQEATRHERAGHFHRNRIDKLTKELKAKQTVLSGKLRKPGQIKSTPRAPVKAVLQSVLNNKYGCPPPPLKLLKKGGDDHFKPLKLKQKNQSLLKPKQENVFVPKKKPSWMSANTFDKSKCIPRVSLT